LKRFKICQIEELIKWVLNFYLYISPLSIIFLFTLFVFSVVGMARGPTLTELVYMGLVGICDPPRPQVRDAIQTLLSCGIRVKMVTGDAQETAIAIGKH
jgi:cation transport ATPase